MSEPTSTAITTAADALAIAIDGAGRLTHLPCDGRPVVVASELAGVLGYAQRNAIADLISGPWSGALTEGVDFRVVRGEALAQMRRAAAAAIAAAAIGSEPTAAPPQNPIAPKSRHCLVLFESGMDKVLAMSDRPAAATVRAALVGRVLPAMRRGEALPATPTPTPTAAPAPTAPASDPRVDRLVGAVEQLVGVVAQLLGRVALPPANTTAAAPSALPAATGASPMAPPAQTNTSPAEIPVSWVNATTIAARASARLQRQIEPAGVGRVIRELRIRERGPAVARCTVAVIRDRGRTREVLAWFYADAIADEIVAHITERHAAASAAQMAFDAVIAAGNSPQPRPRPGPRAAA